MLADRKIKKYEELRKICEVLHKENKKIVFVSGTFDILHVGHSKFCEFAKSHGDVLIVLVGNDDTIRKYKGPGKPITNELQRTQLVASLESVDYAVIGDEPYDGITDVAVIMNIIRPAFFIVPTTDKPETIERKREIAKETGSEFLLYKREELSDTPEISTTGIIKKLSSAR